MESLQAWQIQAVEITNKRVHDSKVVNNLLKQVGKDVSLVIADGAYDTREVYDSIREHSPYAKVVIPSRKNALIWQETVW